MYKILWIAQQQSKNSKKHGKRGFGMACPWGNSKIQFGKVVRTRLNCLSFLIDGLGHFNRGLGLIGFQTTGTWLSQPNPSHFWRNFVSRCQGNKQLVNHFITNLTGVVVVCKQSGIWIFFQCKRLKIQILQHWWIRKHIRIRKNLF